MPTFKVIHRANTDFYSECIERKYHDDDALDDVIGYCLNPQKTKHGYVGGCAVNVNQAAYEMNILARAYGKDRGLRLRHMVLSFSEKEMRKLGRHEVAFYRLNQIAQYAIAYYGSQYQIIYAVHEDAAHGHIHFVMNTVSYRTGLKYGGQKEDYYDFQRYLNSFLKEYFGFNLEKIFAD